MARSIIWQIDMGDGTWSACCMGCRLPLGRGPRAAVARLAGAHVCEPPSPSAGPPSASAGLTRARWARHPGPDLGRTRRPPQPPEPRCPPHHHPPLAR